MKRSGQWHMEIDEKWSTDKKWMCVSYDWPE
jgi:hypothetical protein